MSVAKRAGLCLGLALSASCLFAADEPYVIPTARRDHWAWKSPIPQIPPAIRNAAWVQNPIDAFILAKLEAAGLQPAAPASRSRLLRRVNFDFVGLPPTPEEVDAFTQDTSPDAWTKVIDRLLASPHYGERWGRHWLDLARFAESNGYEHDEVRPDAWRYRDYVIRSFNADKPYDRFMREQVAGDELYPDDVDARIATAFNLLGPDMVDSSDQRQRRLNTLNDMTDTAALAFLGLTVACARCHDHKFDPIPQTDYYRLQAFFTPAVFRNDLPVAERPQRDAYERAVAAYDALTKPVRDELARLEAPYRKELHDKKLARVAEGARQAYLTAPEKRTVEQQDLYERTLRFLVISPKELRTAMSSADRKQAEKLDEQLKALASKKPAALPSTMGIVDAAGQPSKTYLLERGELNQPASEVQPGFPIILSPNHQTTAASVRPMSPSTGRRTALSDWFTRLDNPLTARVLVNRLWQHHFGRGIVPTPSDFGVRGEPPTHPELLDWLAGEFAPPSPQPSPARGEGAKKWSLKHAHRLMLLSATYQQSTSASPEAREKDPDNDLFSRMNRLRLEGEIIRDGLLAVSGRLNRKMSGKSVFPPIPLEAAQGDKTWKTTPDGLEHGRRSVYVFARRNLRFPFLDTFDQPDSNLSCPKREQSTTAPQALALLNDADILKAAAALAERLQREAATDDSRVERAYRLVLGRPPSPSERQRAGDFLRHSPLSEFCRGLFNVNEFVYLD